MLLILNKPNYIENLRVCNEGMKDFKVNILQNVGSLLMKICKGVYIVLSEVVKLSLIIML